MIRMDDICRYLDGWNITCLILAFKNVNYRWIATTENTYDNDNDVIRASETDRCIITAASVCWTSLA